MALTDNIVSYWKLDSNSNDSVGSNNGTDTSISYSNAGKIGNCATLSGSSYIRKTQSSSLQVTNLTVNLWIKKTSGDGGRRCIISYDNGSVSFNESYYFEIGSDNKLLYVQGNGSATTVALASTSTLTADSTWKMITLVRNPSAGTTNFYINGTLDVSRTGNTSALYYGASNDGLAIGGYINSSGSVDNKFIGGLDEFGVWNRALTSTEITELYNAGNGLTYPFTANSSAMMQFFMS